MAKPDSISGDDLWLLSREGKNEVLNKALAGHGEQARQFINQLDGEKLSPLHYAARYRHSDTVKILIHYMANVNIQGQDNLTPLHFAAKCGVRLEGAKQVHHLWNHKTKIRSTLWLDWYRRQKKLTEDEITEKNDPEKVEESDEGEGGEENEEDKAYRDETEEEEEDEAFPENNSQVTDTTLPSISEMEPKGENSIVKILLKKGAMINAPDRYGQTPLHLAAMRGNTEATLDLLNSSADIEAQDEQLMTPLSVAATFGSVDIAKHLVNCGAKYKKDNAHQTPLHKAAMKGHMGIVEFLLEEADRRGKKDGKNYVDIIVKELDSDQQTPLHLAVRSGYIKVASLLLQAGSKVNAEIHTKEIPLHAAAVIGDEKLINLLIRKKSRVDAKDDKRQTPLHHAAAHNQSEAVKFLLRKGCQKEKKDVDSCTPLLLAARKGHDSVVAALLEQGANISAVDKDDKTCLFWCANQGKVKALKILLEHDSGRAMIDQSDRNNDSPLHTAASHGYVKVCRLLLEAGSKIDKINEKRETALHVAAKNGRSKVVRFLLNRDRSLVSDGNEDSYTALHLASIQGNVEVIKTLLEFDADVKARNSDLWTPLDCAARNGHVGVCELLLDDDAPLDPRDKTETTPLMLAAINGHAQVTKLLVERGASLELCDTKGRNALELAISYGRRDVAMTIIQSEEWENALKHVRKDKNGSLITPFRMLVKKFPDVAEMVLKKCTSSNGKETDDPDYEMNINFKYVDDTYRMKQLDANHRPLLCKGLCENPYNEDGKLLDDAQPYTSDERRLKYNHPLSIMIRYKRLNLLAHPLSITLVKHKWMNYGRNVYYFGLLMYLLFLTFLTGYILTASDWEHIALNKTVVKNNKPPRVLQGSMSPLLGFDPGRAYPSYRGVKMSTSPVNTPGCEELENDFKLAQKVFLEAGTWIIIGLAVFHLLKELFQLYEVRKAYFGYENIMEWICYLSAILIVIDFNDGCYVRENWQWQLATFEIFLAWINMLLFIRKIPFLGIYVVMILDILNTFSRFCIVFLLFIVAFALSFYIALKDITPFSTPEKSILKTAIMMLGEIDFDSIFNREAEPGEPDPVLLYPEVTKLIFVAFIVIMSIIVMNLLVGLAVDDIKKIQDQAKLERLTMQTQLVLDVETVIPDGLRRKYSINKKIVTPNKKRVFDGFSIMNEFIDLDEDNKMSDQKEMRQDIDHLKRTLDEVLLLTRTNVGHRAEHRNQNSETEGENNEEDDS